MPNVGGYGGAIAFPVPSPKPSGFDDVPIGVTLSLVAPADSPDLNAQVGGRRPKRRERPARPLLYVTLLPTRDITLATYPRIAIDVPRDIVTTYRVEELGLAFYNSADKAKTYRLAVASQEAASAPAPRSSGSTPPPSATPTATPSPTATPLQTPTPTPTPSLSPGGSPTPLAPGRTPVPTPSISAFPSPSPTLPPQRITFAAAPVQLKLTANKPATFALYALPVAAASPTPTASAGASASASPSASAAAAESAAPAASAAASGKP
jgi:hypothetical protein